jgi:hypothetical protein
MKKLVALTILGITATAAFGQGHVLIDNFLSAPYNQVVWGPGAGSLGGVPGSPIASQPAGVTFQVFYGAGSAPQETLLPGLTFAINAANPYNGGGWFFPVVQQVPTTGTYTFQLRASGGGVDPIGSRSGLFQGEAISTALPAPTIAGVGKLVVVVPEPSTFALAGLGAAALLIFRRRA